MSHHLRCLPIRAIQSINLSHIQSRRKAEWHLGRLAPPDKWSCGHSDTFSLGMMVLSAVHTANLQPSLGLVNFVYHSTREDCSSRVTDTSILKSFLYEYGYTTDSTHASFCAARAKHHTTTLNHMIRTVDSNCIEVSGGQHYTVCKGKSPISTDMYIQSKLKAFPASFDGSVLDIGGGLGYYSLVALSRGASTAIVVDKDEKVRAVGSDIFQRFHSDAHYVDKCDIGCRSRDTVLALGILHLLYVCTEIYSLERVVVYLAKVTRSFLIVEWIEPDDKTIATHLHSASKESTYSRTLFEHSLSKYFDVTGRHPTSKSTRVVYTATRKR